MRSSSPLVRSFGGSLLLLLLLLLLAVDHAPLGEENRLPQHDDIADMVGEDQHQRRVEVRALLVGEATMRLHNGAKGVVGSREVGAGGERHANPQFKPILNSSPSRATALPRRQRAWGGGSAPQRSRPA